MFLKPEVKLSETKKITNKMQLWPNRDQIKQNQKNKFRTPGLTKHLVPTFGLDTFQSV